VYNDDPKVWSGQKAKRAADPVSLSHRISSRQLRLLLLPNRSILRWIKSACSFLEDSHSPDSSSYNTGQEKRLEVFRLVQGKLPKPLNQYKKPINRYVKEKKKKKKKIKAVLSCIKKPLSLPGNHMVKLA
jgi:hypothetical protein